MNVNEQSLQSGIDNLIPKTRRDALQKLIEIGGLDRDLMVELRRQFLALTEREENTRNPENLTERAET